MRPRERRLGRSPRQRACGWPARIANCRQRPRQRAERSAGSAPAPGRVAITTPRNPSAIAIIRSALTFRPAQVPARRATKTGVRNEIVAVSDSWSSRTANTFAVVEQNSRTERNSCNRGRFERSIGRPRQRSRRNERDQRRSDVARPYDLRDRQRGAQPFGAGVLPGEANHRGAHERDRENPHAAVLVFGRSCFRDRRGRHLRPLRVRCG